MKKKKKIKVKVKLLPGVNTKAEIIPIVDDIHNYTSQKNDVIERDWIAFYCTLISREVVQKVGVLDEEFSNTGEDVDYCFRIKKQGYKIIQNYKSFVFHFGAVGRKILESENKEEYQNQDRKNQDYLQEKLNKKHVVLYSGPSWEKWDFKNLDEGGIGGSETWQIQLAKEFDKLGYRVSVFCDCKERIQDGNIVYRQFTEFPKYVDQNWIDYFISSRTTDTLRLPIRSEKNFVMIHDIWLSKDPNYPLYQDKVYKYCVLSNWHKEFVMNHHKIPEDKIVQTSNGIDLKRFHKKVERQKNRLIYSSSPDRGLDTLLHLFDFIKEKIPDLELHVFYGFDNWQKAVQLRNDKNDIEKMEKIKKDLEKPGVFNHGRIGQKKLAKEFLKSSLWAYPTDFEETWCITAIECQCAGLPVIASNFAGLQTTVGDSGILIGNGQKGQSLRLDYRQEFIEKCIELLTNQEKWNYWSKKSLKNAKKYSWKNCALQWKTLFGD